MSQPKSTFSRWFLLPTILMGLHILFAIGASAGGGGTHPEMAGIVWLLFIPLDFPSSLLLFVVKIDPGLFFLIFGTIHWGLIGLLIQAGSRRRRKAADAKK